MTTQLQKLKFSISMIDQVTGPAGRMKKGLVSIGASVASLAAVGFGVSKIMAPVLQLEESLGQVRSLGVSQKVLEELDKTALKFSMNYGKSAAEFVSSAYDIQSAIAGLQNNELAAFTKASNILAAATKSDAATITKYMGTMYDVFKKSADKMGKSKWVEQITGKTALAVRMFKTDGQKMSAAFGLLGKSATASGAGISEQLAVLGSLQGSVSGSESATIYKAFLKGAGKASGKITDNNGQALKFTDDNDQLLGTVAILNKLRAAFGETLENAEIQKINKMFGSDLATRFITNFLDKTEQLKDNIQSIQNNKGQATAENMARAMVHPWQQLSSTIGVFSVVLGKVLLPVFLPIIKFMTSVLKGIINLSDRFPVLTKFLSFVATGLLALSLAFGVYKLAVWAAGLATIKTIASLALALGPLIAFGAAIALIATYWQDIKAAAVSAITTLIDYWDKFISGFKNTIKFLNVIPGVNIGEIENTIKVQEIDNMKKAKVNPGGLQKNFNNQKTTTHNMNIENMLLPENAPLFSAEQFMSI